MQLVVISSAGSVEAGLRECNSADRTFCTFHSCSYWRGCICARLDAHIAWYHQATLWGPSSRDRVSLCLHGRSCAVQSLPDLDHAIRLKGSWRRLQLSQRTIARHREVAKTAAAGITAIDRSGLPGCSIPRQHGSRYGNPEQQNSIFQSISSRGQRAGVRACACTPADE